MKRISTIIIAAALALGMAQCKKTETPTNTTEPEGKWVHITLNVGASKHDVITEEGFTQGMVNYTSGDQIYVGSDNKYIGTLVHNGTTFEGDIYEPVEGQPLHFYFIGGLDPVMEGQLTPGTTTAFDVNISDQSEKLPVLSYARSTQNYTDVYDTYSCMLRNKCALVKFDLTNATADAIQVAGLLNTATLSFADPGNNGNNAIVAGSGTGDITLYNPSAEESTERWAILLPSSDLANATYNEANLSFEGNAPQVKVNGLINQGITIENTPAAPAVPVGGLTGEFTVNADGLKVHFSQGNLQYIGSAGNGDANNTGAYWKFADNQWDYLGNNGQLSNSKTVDRDLFGWGTSGYNHGAIEYQPWTTYSDNIRYYAYGSSSYNLYDQTGQADWGYNAIANGGNTENSGWRTLTTDEWVYLFNTRTAADVLKGHGKVNGVNGMILLPGDWTLPEGLTFTAGNSDYANVYTIEQWAQMEANGAVFLPAAGYRASEINYPGTRGCYWSSSHKDNTYAHYLSFLSEKHFPLNQNPRYYGTAVRLVRNAE